MQKKLMQKSTEEDNKGVQRRNEHAQIAWSDFLQKENSCVLDSFVQINNSTNTNTHSNVNVGISNHK